jgi:predicted dehydrogenase
MSKVRWGILSTAKIGVIKVIPAMQQAANCEIAAIASRDLQRARETASRLQIPKAYGSYEELLADPDIDAIYNPLPNHLHVPLSIQALAAGKHVLCEKPIGLSVAEAEELVEAGRRHPQLKLMEAFMYRLHPQWQRAKQLVESPEFGALRTISTVFSYYNTNDADIRNRPEWGGGGLMDIGCYPISLSRFIYGKEPQRVAATIEYDPRFGVDRLASALLDFGDGTSLFACSTQMVPYQRVNIFGTEGRVEIEIPFNAPPDRPCKMWRQVGERVETIELPTTDQYTVQGELFSQAVLSDTPVPTPIEDAVANMRVIEAIVRAGASGQWETLP